MKNSPNTPKNEKGLIQMIMMGESIRQIWVNCFLFYIKAHWLTSRVNLKEIPICITFTLFYLIKALKSFNIMIFFFQESKIKKHSLRQCSLTGLFVKNN